MLGRPPQVDPTATGPSPSTDGDVAPPRSYAQFAHNPRRLAFPSLEGVSKKLETTRKIAVSLTLIVLIAVGFLVLGREVVKERIFIEPVVVQIDDSPGGLTPELAGQEVLRHFALLSSQQYRQHLDV